MESASSNDNQFNPAPTAHEKGVLQQDAELNDGYDEEELVGSHESDFKKKQVFRGRTLAWLAYQSTGVIYGDIGTSPLYVYSSTFSANPTYDDLVGALSLIIWALTLIVTVKYIFIVLQADDEGEGGTFAAYNLLARYSRITTRHPRASQSLKIERYHSSELRPASRSIRDALERSRFAHAILKVFAVFGVTLIMADGILTPAQSVLGAIQGIEVATPNITTHTIIGVSCAILVVLFVAQPLGITKIASAWAPIVIIWLMFNLAFGIYNLVHFDWTVLKAFSPYFAGKYFARNGTDGWKSLGGILLAFTGVEALFADMGAFSKRAIQLSWMLLAYPCLLLAYIGQATYISIHPPAYSNPFFKTVPPGMFWPSLIISILAAIVASQAIITGTFQLLSQVMNTSYFPHINMIYTSEKFHGQVYIPIANWLMMIGTVIVTAVYNNTTSLGNAYGVCVILVTFLTTNMILIIALVVWKIHWVIAFAVWLPFVTLDGLFLSSALTKIPNGAWFTILLAVLISCMFVIWRYGKEKQWTAEGSGRYGLTELVVKSPDGSWHLASHLGGRELTSIKGMAIFFDKGGDMVPTVYEEFLCKFEARPEVEVFLHLRALTVPHVSEEEKFAVARTSLPNCYRMVVRHGYNDIIITEGLGEVVYQTVRQHIVSSHAANPRSSATDESRQHADARLQRRLATLDGAYKAQTVYILGKEQLRLLKQNNNPFQRFVLRIFLWIRDNTRAKVASMKIPVEKLVEIGFVKEI